MTADSADFVDRLKLLKEKKAAKALNPPEKLELQELTIRQRAIRLTGQKAALSKSKKKLDDALRYKLGGLVIKAGLGSWDEVALLGAFTAIARETNAAAIDAWRAHGGQLINADIEARKTAEAGPSASALAPLAVVFPAPPNEPIRTALRAKGFAWAADRQRWEGQGLLAEIAQMVASFGGSASERKD